MKKYLIISMMALITLLAISATPSFAVEYLPDPETLVYADDGTTVIGKVSSEHDDFVSYSADLLNQLEYISDGSIKGTGTGTLGVIVYTGAGGQNNEDADGTGLNFPDTLDSDSGTSDFDYGTWGGDTLDEYTPLSVDTVVDYLHASFGDDVNTPVFAFDNNQQGGKPDILVSGQVQVWTPEQYAAAVDVGFDYTQTVATYTWAFDGLDNGVFDPYAMVPALGNIIVGEGACEGGSDCYVLDNNTGSGSLDFLAYAPTMNLSQYYDQDFLFTADFWIGDPGIPNTEDPLSSLYWGLLGNDFDGALNNGPEELYLSGTFAPTPNAVPEPASLLLLGSGLFGFGLLKRKKK